MQRLYASGDLTDAYLVLHLLSHAGIAARVLNEYAQGVVGEGPVCPEVWVERDGDLARARAIVAQFEASRAHAGVPARRCRACGEDNPSVFEVCWHCGKPFE